MTGGDLTGSIPPMNAICGMVLVWYGIDNIISVTTLTLTYWKSDNLFVVKSIVWAVGQIAKLKLCC